MTRVLDFDALSDEDKEWLTNWNRQDEIPSDQRDEEPEMVFDLGPLRKPELQEQARLRELDDSGTMADLQNRIEAYDAGDEDEDED